MKRMVLIPEEKLLRYEEQLNDQPPTNEQAEGSIFTGGFRPPIHYPIGIILDMIIYIITLAQWSEEAKMKDLCLLK